ncbi:TPA: DUF551 domain-containing protein [Citrobacter freundii]|nr:DUF551 domain-containing protein [Citrobacter freundii]
MTTNNHPAHGPVSLDRLHQIREILSKAAAQSDGGNLGYAMADAVKVINGAIAAFGAEPVGTFRKGPCGYHPSFHEDAVPLYAAPPAPVVLEELLSAMEEVLRISDRNHEAWHKARNGIAACRAAMLQAEPASNSDELPPDYLQGHKDGLEWAAQLAEANHPQTGDWLYDDPIELARAIRKGPDMPTVQDGNSPVTPDGWIPVSDRMPETDGNYWGWWSESKRQGPVWFIKSDLQAQFQSSEITHWMPLPAAPQQEVKSALEHGMRRYAGAMQKLSEGDK